MKVSTRWIVVNTCRLLVSAIFILSGLVKLIDPHGTEYKIEDYLVAMGLDGVLVQPLPLFFAVGMALLEFCLGIYLLFGIRRRLTTRTILAFMLVYTPLTLWLALTDAVADCGCFGDALVLTNWQTFGKNVCLLAAAVLLCRTRAWQTRLISESAQWLISIYSVVYGLALALLCLWGEPVIDFRPFHVGQDIAAAMEWPDDGEGQPEILDFSFEPIAGLDNACDVRADDVLADKGYTFLLIAPYLESADDGNMDRINAIADYADEYGYRFLCLTASDSVAIRRWQDLTGADYAFAFADELMLKTIVRSNPGLMLLRGGVVMGKWSHNTLPAPAELTAPLHSLALAHPQPGSYRRMLLALLLWYVVPLVLLTLLDRLVAVVRWQRRKANS